MAPRHRMGRRRAKGQSLPLIALMIVVLVAMVGLSVDVGNTFQEERQAVSAANAASLAGMNTVIRDNGRQTNGQVFQSIINSLSSNGVEITADGVSRNGQLILNATYIDPQGNPISTIPNNGATIPDNVGYVQVQLQGIVDTYFARVVGRSDLPINASAYAGRCSLGDGVYPIAVDQDLLDGARFLKTQDLNPADGKPDASWRVLESGPYRGFTARHVYVHDGSQQPGSFGFLRWTDGKGQMGTNSTSKNELEASLAGFGNLSWGFQEAPEPNTAKNNEDPNAPGDYPLRPGELNEGDWVWGTPGWKQGGTDGPLGEHIANGTRMILPIYDEAVGQGTGDNNGVRFHVVKFGTFVMLSQVNNNAGGGGNNGGNGNKYFDLVYLGPAQRQATACQFSPVPPNASDCCELWGEVSFWPEYQIVPQSTVPIQYVVVLDQSGSMSANFDGQCDNGSPPLATRYLPKVGGVQVTFPDEPAAFWQCANGPLYDTNLDADSTGDTPAPDQMRTTGTGSNYWWGNADERRIAVAKQALETLIGLTNMPGNDNYTTTYPDDQMALVWFTDWVAREGNNETFANGRAFTNNTGELVSKMWARSTHSSKDTKLTTGGTNGAAALWRAGRILDQAPKEVVHTDGRTFKYKQVVLFITDGVSNQFFHPDRSDLKVRQSDWNSYGTTNDCRTTYQDKKDLIIEDAECQTTEIGGAYNWNGTLLDRPVTQAIKVSQDILQKNGYSVFVLALSNLPATGLAGGIPSFPHYYKAVPSLVKYPDGSTNVDQVVKDINGIVENDRCQNGKDPNTINTITSGQFRPVNMPDGTVLNYPNVGRVTITNSVTDQTYFTEIVADPSGGLRYRFPKVPPGVYSMSASLYYKHPQDPAGINNRAYEDFFDGSSKVPAITVDVTNAVRSGSFLPSTQQDIDMRLRGNPCAGAGL